MAFLSRFLNKKKSERKDVAKKTFVKEEQVISAEKDSQKLKGNFVPGVLLSFVTTEKTNLASKAGKYTFWVAKNKNKLEVKKAVEKIYGVKAESVKILNMPSKKRRLGRIIGRVPGFKKAVVTLKKGQEIEIQ